MDLESDVGGTQDVGLRVRAWQESVDRLSLFRRLDPSDWVVRLTIGGDGRYALEGRTNPIGPVVQDAGLWSALSDAEVLLKSTSGVEFRMTRTPVGVRPGGLPTLPRNFQVLVELRIVLRRFT
mgnify:CR=1 FL=1